jgi:hypothetical protein
LLFPKTGFLPYFLSGSINAQVVDRLKNPFERDGTLKFGFFVVK